MEKDLALQLESKLSEIEEEMKKIGSWNIQAPLPEAYTNMGAFGMNTMAFEQWLHYVFIPRVRELIKQDALPPSSSVGVHAIREFDGNRENDTLLHLLIEFDKLIPRPQTSNKNSKNMKLILIIGLLFFGIIALSIISKYIIYA